MWQNRCSVDFDRETDDMCSMKLFVSDPGILLYYNSWINEGIVLLSFPMEVG